MKWLVPEYIRAIRPYVPGKPIEELEREYGIAGSIKLASNENPIGSSPKAMAAMTRAMASLHRYPDGAGYGLVKAVADTLAIPKDRIVIGNGSDDIISLLTKGFLQPGDSAIMPVPSFLMYEISVRAAWADPVFVPLTQMAIDLDAIARAVTPATRMVFLCNPNNPTGSIIRGDDFPGFLDRLPDTVIVVIDEAYIEFARDPGCLQGLAHVGENRPVVVLRTFSKLYGLAGLRVGYGVMAPGVAGILHRIRQPFNVNSIAQAAAAAALEDETFVRETLELVHRGLDDLYRGLDHLGLAYVPSQSNFFLIKVDRNADRVFEEMLKQGVIVRSMTSYGFPDYIRINVGLPEENRRFLDALAVVCKTVPTHI
jgi:histidinol-phosphate aminotransferase